MTKRSPIELFEHYYTALVYSLPMKDATFMDELPKHGLLPEDIKTKLELLTEHNQRASCFLDSVMKPVLVAGNSGCFVSLLAVMKSYKHDNVKELGIKIEKELATSIKCKIIFDTNTRIMLLYCYYYRSIKATLKRFVYNYCSGNC